MPSQIWKICSTFFLLSWGLLTSANAIAEQSSTKDLLNVVCDLRKPYAYTARNSEGPLGSDIEILNTIFSDLNYKFRIRFFSTENMKQRMENGRADIALGVRKTKAMIKISKFLKTPIRTLNYHFFGRLKDKVNPKMTYLTAKEQNKMISIQSFHRYPKKFWKFFPFENELLNKHLKEANSIKMALYYLNNDTTDLAILEREEGLAHIFQEGSRHKITHYDNILFYKDYYIALSNKSKILKNMSLLKTLEKNLMVLHQKGKTNMIRNKWIVQNLK